MVDQARRDDRTGAPVRSRVTAATYVPPMEPLHATGSRPSTAARRALGQVPEGMGPPYFPTLVGLVLEEVRTDYARMRLPYRPELEQPAGVVHGGAIATLIDTVVVPAVGQAYDAELGVLHHRHEHPLHRRGRASRTPSPRGGSSSAGRSLVFCRAEVRTEDGKLAADGTLTYTVRPPRE